MGRGSSRSTSPSGHCGWQTSGLGHDQSGGQVTAVRVLVSGGVSLAGLSLDVDDLSVGAPWPAANDSSLTDPAAWSIDLAGLDVAYSGGGISSGRRASSPGQPDSSPATRPTTSASSAPTSGRTA